MATKKTQIQVKRNSNAEYDAGDITLRIGEPFYNKPTNDFFVGDGINMIENLIPINHSPILARHEVVGTTHKFTILNGSIGSLEFFPVVSKFMATYESGQTAQLIIPTLSGVNDTYTVTGIKSTQNELLGDNAFVQGTVNCFFVSIDNKQAKTATIFFQAGSSAPTPGPGTTYTVTYSANGKTGATNIPSQTTYNDNDGFTISSLVPTVTNYTFLGWSENSGASTATYQPGVFVASLHRNVTLYAVWQAVSQNISVQFNMSQTGTSANPDNPYSTDVIDNTPESMQVASGYVYTFGPNPELDGYTFVYWKDNNNNTYVAGNTVTITAPITFTAVWQRVGGYTIKFYNESTELSQYTETNRKYRDMLDISSKTTSKSGYFFTGWTYDGQTVLSSTFEVPYNNGNKNISLSAVFEATPVVNYTVTYDANGGSYSSVTPGGSYAEGSRVDVNLSNIPVKSGKVFMGYKDGDDVTYKTGGTTYFIMPAHNVTLTAQWADSIYTLEYTRAFSEHPADQTNATGIFTLSAPLASMIKEQMETNGKTFGYWQINGQGSFLNPGNTYTMSEPGTKRAWWVQGTPNISGTKNIVKGRVCQIPLGEDISSSYYGFYDPNNIISSPQITGSDSDILQFTVSANAVINNTDTKLVLFPTDCLSGSAVTDLSLVEYYSLRVADANYTGSISGNNNYTTINLGYSAPTFTEIDSSGGEFTAQVINNDLKVTAITGRNGQWVLYQVRDEENPDKVEYVKVTLGKDVYADIENDIVYGRTWNYISGYNSLASVTKISGASTITATPNGNLVSVTTTSQGATGQSADYEIKDGASGSKKSKLVKFQIVADEYIGNLTIGDTPGSQEFWHEDWSGLEYQKRYEDPENGFAVSLFDYNTLLVTVQNVQHVGVGSWVEILINDAEAPDYKKLLVFTCEEDHTPNN